MKKSKKKAQKQQQVARQAAAAAAAGNNNVERAEALKDRGLALFDAGRVDEAIVQWKASSAMGHGGAMFSIGVVLEHGEGVPKNVAEAHEWYKRSAAAGDLRGMTNLAMHLRTGLPDHGVAMNRAKALRLVKDASEAGFPVAMFNYGKWLGEEDKDDPQQVLWLRRAADAGSKDAMNALGACYDGGRGGLTPDSVAAVAWFRKAAELGDHFAMCNLALDHEQGVGVEKNLATAAKWYERAIEAGSPTAAASLERVKIFLAAEAAEQQTSSSSSSSIAASSSASTSTAPKACSACGLCGAPAFDRCSACQEQRYCSQDCQRTHWKVHKIECKAKQAEQKEQKKAAVV